MPDQIAATPEAKLEEACAQYTKRNYAADLGLKKTAILEGQNCDPIDEDATDRIVFEASPAGGELADLGDYEVPLAMWIVTRAHKQPNDSQTPQVRHALRVNALTGIFSEDRKAQVCSALMAIDDALIVSSYWGYEREDHSTTNLLITCLRRTVDCALA